MKDLENPGVRMNGSGAWNQVSGGSGEPSAAAAFRTSLRSLHAMPNEESIATRASLLGRLKDHADQASWQEFFDTYWRLIYSVATRAGLSDAEAQDVVQETVIAVARNVGEFRYDPRVCAFKTWMLRLTRWRILDRLRQRQREAAGLGHRLHLTPSPDPAAAFPWPEEGTDQTATLDRLPDPAGVDLERIWNEEWHRTTIEVALASIRHRIKPEHYQMFHLYVVKELPVRQVARMVGVSVPSVYLAKHRVAALLKGEMLRLEITMARQIAAGPSHLPSRI